MSQSASPDHTGTETPIGGYGPALKPGFQETTRRIQDMQRAIVDLSFQALRWIPGMAGPARLARDAHDLIADGIYTTIRQSSSGLLAVAALLEWHTAAHEPAKAVPPGQLATSSRSAPNAAVGDYLAASANPLAITMGFHAAGHPISLTTDGLRAHLPDPSDRLCLFIHGLGCDEHCWQLYSETAWDPPGQHYGPLLRAELGYTPLYLRYNTGLPITDNSQQLARQIQLLLAAYPQPVRELVLIGHSMGGLVARGACEQAAVEALPWLGLARMVICLGSPHRGAPLEKMGHLTTTALHLSAVTAPLGKIADARSAGVKSLRHGLKNLRHGPHAHENNTRNSSAPPSVAYRFIGTNLARNADHPLGHVLGDGLVTLGSATPPELPSDVAIVRLDGLSHLALLNEPRVYRQIKRWLNPQNGEEASSGVP